MLNIISNTPSTSFIQRGAKASIEKQENKEIQNREMIRHWLKKLRDYASISPDISLPRQIDLINKGAIC